ncbi:MAG: COG1361 S-layer family protein [Nanoarchaeota archaeon]|nr:COG1361 S-layer family protein [Nanoarchaeota archaeon]MBU1974536.1 COG1361 S-layer family protein [Nanoarchaeota archaeon]
MKKNLILVSFIVLLLLPLAYAGVNQITETTTAQLYVTLMSQDPDPVEPGQIVNVKFKIENEGQQTSEDVIVKILPQYPFKIYGDKAEKNIGKLRAVATGADAVIVEFKLKVDENAVEEDTELELQILMEGGAISYTNDEFLINIQTHDAVLDITSITLTPEQIAPGETAEVSIMVKNLADSLLKDIKFKLDFDSTTLPLAPYQSSSERRISQLQSGYQNSLAFGIVADPEAAPGLYKIPLTITYNDEQGSAYSIEDILAITVGDMPKLRVYIKKSDVLQKNKAGKVTIEIANAGSSDIKFLELTLLPSDDYQLVSTTDYFYLGDVDSDDTESEEIDLFINKKVETLHLPIKLKYTDANNKPFQQQFDLELELYSSSQLKKFGLLEKSKAGTYFFIFILIIVGIYLYRRRKKDPENFSKDLRRWRNKIPLLKSKKK